MTPVNKSSGTGVLITYRYLLKIEEIQPGWQGIEQAAECKQAKRSPSGDKKEECVNDSLMTFVRKISSTKYSDN